MPFDKYHSCRVRNPGDFKPDSFRTKDEKLENGKTIRLILGRLKDEDTMTLQAYRYPTDEWTPSEAKDHCKSHDGSFTEAGETDSLVLPRSSCAACAARFTLAAGSVDSRGLVSVERRIFPFIQVRTEKREKGQHLKGHAAVFNSIADLGWFKEMVKPGAFKDSIGQDDICALFNHDPNYVLGRNKAGTLTLGEDERGLAVDIDPPDTQWARDLIVSMERGDIEKMSFGFEVLKATWETIGEEDVRVLERVKLRDTSIVTFPAYTETDAQVRSIFDEHLAASKQGLNAAEIEAKCKQALEVESSRRRRELELAGLRLRLTL